MNKYEKELLRAKYKELKEVMQELNALSEDWSPENRLKIAGSIGKTIFHFKFFACYADVILEMEEENK